MTYFTNCMAAINAMDRANRGPDYDVIYDLAGRLKTGATEMTINSAFEIGQYVSKAAGAGFEGEVRAVYTSRKGIWMAVVEITGGPFAGMQHIYQQHQLYKCKPSAWFNQEQPK